MVYNNNMLWFLRWEPGYSLKTRMAKQSAPWMMGCASATWALLAPAWLVELQGTSPSHRAAPQPTSLLGYLPSQAQEPALCGSLRCVIYCKIRLLISELKTVQQVAVSLGVSEGRDDWLQMYAFKGDMQRCKSQMVVLEEMFSPHHQKDQRNKQYGSCNYLIRGCLLMVGSIS